jgi:hypothetical protein
VAYGARLESVLGASPRGFESLSLRQNKKDLPVAGLFYFDTGAGDSNDKAKSGFGPPVSPKRLLCNSIFELP